MSTWKLTEHQDLAVILPQFNYGKNSLAVLIPEKFSFKKLKFLQIPYFVYLFKKKWQMYHGWLEIY